MSARKGPSAGPSHFWRPLMNSTVVVRADDQAEPSLVVFGRDDAGKPRASWFDAGSADQGPGPAPTAPADPRGGPSRPQSWDEIGIGSVVLATVGVEDGWWESIVIGVNGEALTLKWRDFPREPVFVRRRTKLALLPCSRELKLPHLGWRPAQVPRSIGDHH